MREPLDRFPHVRVAVVGDLMLDSYLHGEVSRISPEAPVPVMRAVSERAVPGGAANVAANLATLGVRVHVVGLCGQDDARDQLVACLAAVGDVDCTRVVSRPGRRTTRKLRVVGARQQIVRIDHEDPAPPDAEAEAALVAGARGAVDAADVVVLSDYAKGVCSDAVVRAVVEHAAAAGKPVIVDPKRRDFSVYRGASVITPNRKELAEATGIPCETDADAAAAAARAQAACGAHILLTRSEKGMSFFPVGGAPTHLATAAQAVFDVSGAGDTVVAVLAAAVAARVPFVDAMRLANHAAGIVVSKTGTATVTRGELAASLAAEHTSAGIDDGRLVDREEAAALRWAWAGERLTVGLAHGCFDGLHPGHVSLLRRAAVSCDRLIVAVYDDAAAGRRRRARGRGPLAEGQAARAAVVGAVKGVSAVVLLGEDTPLELVRALQPDVLVERADGAGDGAGDGADVVHARGGRVLVVDGAAAPR